MWDAFWRWKTTWMPFEATPLAPSHTIWEPKRKLCGVTSEVKSADLKKEGVWHDLSMKGANLQIFSEKGSHVVWPPCPFFTTWQKRKVGGATSAGKSANLWIFSEKGNCVAWPPEILYFFVYQYRLNAPMGEVNRQWLVGLMESMCSMGVLNGKVFWMLLGILLCAQQGIIGGLNGDVLCAQWKNILDAPW